MATNFNITIPALPNPAESNLSPVPLYAAAPFSNSANAGGTLIVTFTLLGSPLPLNGHSVEMFVTSPSFPPGFGPFGVANVNALRFAMVISGNTAQVPGFGPFVVTGPYLLDFSLYGPQTFTAVPTILVVTY